MLDIPQAQRTRPGGSLAPNGSGRSSAALAAALVLSLADMACGDGSLDEPSVSLTSSSEDGTTLPPIDSGGESSTGEGSTGEPQSDDPRLCPSECDLELLVDWVYEGLPPPPGPRPEPPDPKKPDPAPPDVWFDPQSHWVPAMLRDPEDGSLIVVEQTDGFASLHQLDRYGQLTWNVAPALPCDVCELSHVALHPSGDLLLSAVGLLLDRGLGLVAARYDRRRHALVWATTTLLEDHPVVPVRSGEIAALPGGTIAQLYLQPEEDFNPQQSLRVIEYDANGTVVEIDELDRGQAMATRHPMLARPSADGELVVGLPAGQSAFPFGIIDHLAPPLWNTSSFFSVPFALDDLIPDARGHTLELGHTFDGQKLHLVLDDRAGTEPEPRWITTAVFDSVSPSRAALALGPEGEPYAVVRTEQALAEDAEPLVGLSMARWTTEGELRWQLTVLERLDPGYDTLELAIDETDGLNIATVIDDRLRVQRRRQRCACG